MKNFIIGICVLIVLIIGGPIAYFKINRYLNSRPIINAEALRNEIIKSIQNPFPEADTLIIKTVREICGNTDPDKVPTTFETKLKDLSYQTSLSQQIKLPVISMPEYHKAMDTLKKISAIMNIQKIFVIAVELIKS